MNLALGALAVLALTAITTTAMLLVRRRAPAGSYFSDGDRASGVFGVLATGFSILLGFIIFLAFDSYDESRSGAESEATIVAQQVQTAQFLPDETGSQLTGQLICYARAVVGSEWPRMDEGTIGDSFNPWGPALYLTIADLEPTSDTEQSAYDRWMDQTAQREQARLDRIHGAEGVLPTPLWAVLVVISILVFTYMLFFADSAEGPVTQALLMGSVTMVISLLLAVLLLLEHPHGDGIGKLQPTAMERTLRLIDIQLDVLELDPEVPCDAAGSAE